MITAPPSPREIEARAVAQETERLLVEVRLLLDALPVVEADKHPARAAVRHTERRTRPG